MSAGTGEWVRVDLDLVEKLGADAAVLYGLIAYRCQGRPAWTATQEQMVTESRLTLHRVRRSLDVLRDQGLVETRRTGRFDPTLTITLSPGHAVNQESLITSCGEPEPLVMMDSLITLSTKNVRTPPTPTGGGECDLFGIPTSAADPAPSGPGFDEWWAAYPRKVGKGAARKAWEKITRDTAPGLVHAGLQRQLQSLQDAHERGYCPHPTTWLNQERWADESDNVRHLPTPAQETYDPAWERQLPPPRTDPFASGVL